MLKLVLLSHLRSKLAPKANSFLSFPVSIGALRTLGSVLSQHKPDCDFGLDVARSSESLRARDGTIECWSGISDGQLAFLKGQVFAKTQHLHPIRLVRACVHMESELDSSDMAVHVHDLLAANRTGKTVLVDSAAASFRKGERIGAESFVLSLGMLSLHALQLCTVWEAEPSLQYFLRPGAPVARDIPEDLKGSVSEVLGNLSSPSVTGHYEVAQGQASALELLQIFSAAGLVVPRANQIEDELSEWSLTEDGKRAILVGQPLVRGSSLSKAPKDMALDDMTLWELSQVLTSQGWSMVVVTDKKKNRVHPYTKGGPLLWYCTRKATIGKGYLKCLIKLFLGELTCSKKEVPHFKMDGYYADMLAGREPDDESTRRPRTSRRHHTVAIQT